MPGFPQLTEPLSDGQTRLRLSSERDIPEILIAHQDDPQMHERLGADRAPSGAELGSKAERAQEELLAGTHLELSILRPGSEDCCGQVDVHEVEWDHSRAELGIWVAPRERNHGLGRGALQLVSRWLLGSCGLERVALITEPANVPMIRIARAAGFVAEGVLRGYTRERGKRVDCAVYSLIRSDLEP